MAQASTKTRYTVVREFDYLTAGETYDFQPGKKFVDVRRVDGSGSGTFLPMWQFKRALADNSLVSA